MKQTIKFIAVLVTGLFTFFVTSCGNDDMGDSKGTTSNGVITVEYEGAKTFTYYAYFAQWLPGHSALNWTQINNFKNGATFEVSLSEEKPSEVETFMGEPFLVNSPVIRWELRAADEIVVGAELTMVGSHWPEPEYDNTGYSCHDFSGKVSVKSIQDDKITLLFKDFRFKRIKRFIVGRSEFQDLTVNGEITFMLDKETYQYMQ